MSRRLVAVSLVAILCAPPLHAGFFERIYRGLDVLATPSGSPIFPSGVGGASNGNRFGRLRIVPDRAGRGYTLEFNRTFGTDALGRPEVLDLGAYELELSGAINSTMGFTRRSFGADGLAERGFLIGNGDLVVSALNYSLRAKSGVQDVELNGTLNVSNNIEINALGFYEAAITVSNTNSSLIADGIAVEGDLDTDFDTGPISVQGNVFFDLFVLTLSSLGVDTEPLESLFPRSPIDLITAELQNTLDRQAAELSKALESGDVDAAALGLRADVLPGPVGSEFVSSGAATVGPATPAAVPEPTIAATLALGGFLAFRRGRR